MSSENDLSLFLGSECSWDVNSETHYESGEDLEVIYSRLEPYEGEFLANNNEKKLCLIFT